MEQKTWSLYNLLVYSLRPWKLPFPINEQSTNSTKVYNPPINPADRIQHLLPTRYNMGIEYSTPLVALTSAWFLSGFEIFQVSMNKNQSVVNAFLPIMFKASGQARCPIAFSCFPPALRRGVQLTACKGI